MADEAALQQSPRSRKQLCLWIGIPAVALVLLTCGVLYFSFSQNPAIIKYRKLVLLYSSRREMRKFLRAAGPYAPFVFVALQALQVVAAPIPGEATGFLGGLLFGTTMGFLYSSLGLTIGSAIAFGLGRRFGVPLVRCLVSEAVYHRFDFLARTGGEIATLVLFLIPGFPKDVLCFILGMSPMPFVVFLVITTFGRMPGTWWLSVQGAKVGSAHYHEFLVFLIIAAVVCVLAYNYRERVYQWMHRRHSVSPRHDPDGPA